MATSELDHVKAVWQNLQGNSPIYDFLLFDVEIVSAIKGTFVAHLVLKQNHVNSRGTIHGAVSAALVDWSGGMAIATHGLEKTGASIDIHITYVSTAQIGDTIEIEAIANKFNMDVCKICSQDLILELDPEDFDEATSSVAGGSNTLFPDDIQIIQCGCHFHWQCLLDESPKIISTFSCPACNTNLLSPTSSSAQSLDGVSLLTRYHNEGGIQENLDIMPLVKEEAYLDANPWARPARAFLTICGEGDVTGIVELLNAIQEDPDEDDISSTDILRYQDPLDNMKTALHIAIEKEQEAVVWLLLWLASHLNTESFPDEVTQAANIMGASRETAQGTDIRGMRDNNGLTASDVARRNNINRWAGILAAGVLEA
ncbi:hypothetical protein B7463_g7634, partial [Scytalidium lignicola]